MPLAKFGKRLNAFVKRHWQREALKHRWRAMQMALPRWQKRTRFPLSVRAFVFGLKLPPHERVAQLKAYVQRLHQRL